MLPINSSQLLLIVYLRTWQLLPHNIDTGLVWVKIKLYNILLGYQYYFSPTFKAAELPTQFLTLRINKVPAQHIRQSLAIHLMTTTQTSSWWQLLLTAHKMQRILHPTITNTFWFLTYLQLYVETFTGYTFCWHLQNIQPVIDSLPFNIWWRRLYTQKFLKSYMCTKEKFFYILVNLILFKNIDKFLAIIIPILWNIPIKKHKKYFYELRNILRFIFTMLKAKQKMLGFSIFFKGKLNRKGSVKKSVFFYKYGRVSYTNKSLRVNYKKFLMHTETGIIGCGIHLFF